jgi:signal transduction histidine kinase
MRIRDKIFLGYLSIMLVSVVLVIGLLVTLSSINNRYRDLLNRDTQVLILANNLRSGVQRQIAAARTYEQLLDPNLMAEYNQSLQVQQESLEKITPLLTEEEDIKLIEGIKKSGLRYSRAARQAMELAERGQEDAVVSFKRIEGEPARIALVNQCDVFIARKEEEVESAQKVLSADVDDASTRLLLGAIVGVMTALGASTLLTEGITSPLRRLVRNVQGIASGDLQTAVAVSAHDEVGELGMVLETMRQKLAEAAAENEALLLSAREEADKLAQVRRELEAANAVLEEALLTEHEARRHIEEISRLRAEFSSMVSHELKTPVSYVYNYAAALKEHNESLNDGQRREFLTAIQSEAQHLLTLIDDILAISLLESGGLNHRFVETDLRKLADAAVKDQQLTTRRHTLTVKGPDTLPVHADPTRLKQVLNNLLSNAIKYSPQGGQVEVRLRENQADGTAIIYVRDYGLGIRAADVPKLFDRFTRIQRRETMAIAGSGLGLYIAHHIVEAHGGTLSLEPAPGKGTIAQVTIPLELKPGKDEEATQGTKRAKNGRKTEPIPDEVLAAAVAQNTGEAQASVEQEQKVTVG